jgi:hydroxyacylglutathione hydrolase
MFLQQFYEESLGHFSYLIGSEDAGVCAVVDPRRDVDAYLALAQEQRLRITHILETHVHNDYLSGARELAAFTEAEICSGSRSGLEFPHRDLQDGDELRFGPLRVHALATPGHTPEHFCYSVADTSRAEEPFLLLSGGDLLTGSVGRTDLLGADQTHDLTAQLYRSLHTKILTLPDYVQVLPTHGAGSSCGASIAMWRATTIGFERRHNAALQATTEEEFARVVLGDQSPAPAYYARMRPSNQRGPEVLRALPVVPPLRPAEVRHQIEQGALLVDARAPAAFGGAHIEGSLNIGLDSRFTTWVGSVVPPDQRLILVLDRDAELSDAVRQLIRIGYAELDGYLAGGIGAWAEAGLPVAQLPQISVQRLRRDLDDGNGLRVLDVRHDNEWGAGHIAGAVHVAAEVLPHRIGELDAAARLAVICGSGYRSSVAASLLGRSGFRHLSNVIGGMSAWEQARYPVVAGDQR